MTGNILISSIERDAILRCQEGDREAFRRVLDFHGDHMYRTALLITRDATFAEDAVQEALIRAWKKIHHFKAGSNLRAWLNRILINCISNLSSKKQLPSAPEQMAANVRDPEIGPEESVLTAETSAMLKAALSTLSVEHRTVLVLKYFNEMTVPQIVESTGWKPGTVMSRLHRATAALRDAVAARERTTSRRPLREEA